MECTGTVKDISRDWRTNQLNLTISINENVAINEIDKLKDDKLSIKITKYRKKRSLDANGLLWVCLGQIAEVLRTDKWEVYLQMLKRYGKYTYICVKPNVVDAVKAQWRECEIIGEIEVRYTSDNLAIGKFSIAVDTGYGDKKKTNFFNCTVFGKQAETMQQYVTKGKKILLECEALQNTYTDKNGNNVNTVDFKVLSFEFCESAKNDTGAPANTPSFNPDGFMNIPDDADLPF